MRVWLDPQKLAARDLTAGDVVRGHPRAERAGRRRRRRRSRRCRTAVDFQLTVNARGRLVDEEQFGDIIVKTGDDGEITRLRDVARIELRRGDYALRSLLDNKPAVAHRHLPAARLQRARSSPTDVRATMERAEDATSRRASSTAIVYDPTVFVRDVDPRGGAHAARGDRCWWCIVVVLFLQTLARVDHPAARGAGLARRHVRRDARCSGSRINKLSLFGLVLAIGIVVDDAIVVVENVERNIEARPLAARRDATRRWTR